MSALKFKVREILAKNGLEIHEQVPPESLQDQALGASLMGRLKTDLEFSVGGSRILMTGSVSGSWKLTCARCLEDYEAAFANEIDQTYPATEEEIDAEEEIRQGLLLSAPTKPLCRPDCKGLCATCGKDLNQGPCPHATRKE